MSESTSESTSESMAALFRRLTCGVYVVGVAHAGRRRAFTAAWVTQVSFDPLLLALSINPEHASYPLLVASGAFAVSVLRQGQLELARHFGTRSGRDEDKLAGVAWSPARRSGAPVLDDALAYFDCELTDAMRVGDRELVIGRVVDGRILDGAAAPMTYAETGDMDGSGALYPRSL
jgi:flavin reductase (DIM6/NTAB) family NADH-FMN oxidoreductase RutF